MREMVSQTECIRLSAKIEYDAALDIQIYEFLEYFLPHLKLNYWA